MRITLTENEAKLLLGLLDPMNFEGGMMGEEAENISTKIRTAQINGR